MGNFSNTAGRIEAISVDGSKVNLNWPFRLWNLNIIVRSGMKSQPDEVYAILEVADVVPGEAQDSSFMSALSLGDGLEIASERYRQWNWKYRAQ